MNYPEEGAGIDIKERTRINEEEILSIGRKFTPGEAWRLGRERFEVRSCYPMLEGLSENTVGGVMRIEFLREDKEILDEADHGDTTRLKERLIAEGEAIAERALKSHSLDPRKVDLGHKIEDLGRIMPKDPQAPRPIA